MHTSYKKLFLILIALGALMFFLALAVTIYSQLNSKNYTLSSIYDGCRLDLERIHDAIGIRYLYRFSINNSIIHQYCGVPKFISTSDTPEEIEWLKPDDGDERLYIKVKYESGSICFLSICIRAVIKAKKIKLNHANIDFDPYFLSSHPFTK